jgi:2-haloacid dehalogenase
MIKAALFDVFGTVVDWRSGVTRQAEAFFSARDQVVDAAAFADAWRGKYQPAMAKIRAGQRGYVALDILHRENLDAVLAEFGLGDGLDDDARARLNRAWEKLPPWPDSVPGLTALKAQCIIAPCSNGSIALMTRLARFAGLPWDAVLGAEIAQAYKPQPEVYLASCRALGLAPRDVMMIAAHNDDLEAARTSGLKCGFVMRPREHGRHQTSDLAPSAQWDVVASDLVDLAEQVLHHS